MTIKELNKIKDPWERTRTFYDQKLLSDEEFIRRAKKTWNGGGSPVGAALMYINLSKGDHLWQK